MQSKSCVVEVTDIGEARMTRLELLETIANGENSGIEFKRDDRGSRTFGEDFAKEVVAFANFKGGKILIGVEDSGEISGLIEGGCEQWVMNICRNLVKPGMIPYYEEIRIEEQTRVAIAHIDMGLSKPYYVERGERRAYYIRVGSTSREASREELGRLFQASGAFHYDVAPIPNTSLDDLDREKLADYFEKFRGMHIDLISEGEFRNLLINSDIIRETEYGELATVGGLLTFGETPQRYLTQSSISFACYAGSRISSSLLDRRDITGTLVELIDDTVKAIKANMRTPSEIEGLMRVERIIPDEVIREAITNAIAHRDYTIYGTNIRVFMFDDRIEFRSPGALPNTVTVEKMKVGGTSVARNPFLVRYLVEFRRIDKLGRGVLMMFQRMAEIGAPEPELREEGEEFILTLFHPRGR
ncbi:putative DNA binding domain-containing protein [Dehalococcoidia bacterium]|nr:putative DNA binding domain-containing protein [Dehalococcoidia bacterium]